MKFASCLVVIVLFALVLRVWNLPAQSLDMDELAESQVRGLSYVESAVRADSMPPLYPVLLKGWLAIFSGEMAARWLSVAIGVATVAAVGVLWARCFGAPLALVVAGLLAISPLHIYYSQHVRGYVLLFLWAAVTIPALLLAVKNERRSDWVMFVVGSLGGLYSHYYFALFWGVLALVGAWSAYGWKFSRQWWVACVTIGVLSLPLLGFVRSDLHYQKSIRAARSMHAGAFGYTYLSMATGYCVGPSKNEIQQMSPRDAMIAGAPISAVVGSIYLILGGWGIVFLRQRRLLVPVLVLLFVPVLMIGLLGWLTGVTYNPRFVVWSLLPLLMLLGAGVVQGGRSWSVRIAVLGLVLVSVLAIYNRQSVARYQNEDVRAVGNYLNDQTEERGPVFVLPSYMTGLAQHYFPEGWTVEGVADLESGRATEEVDRVMETLTGELPASGPYWVFYSRAFHGDPNGELLGRMIEDWSIVKQQEFAGVVLYRGNAKDAK